MAEASLGGSVALAALAPIAERLADERERQAEREERRQQLEEELAARPSLEQPQPPGVPTPWWATELQEVMLGLVMVGVPVTILVVGGFVVLLGSSPFVIALGVICGAGGVSAWTIKDTRDDLRRSQEATVAREDYARAIKAFDAREAERVAIRAKIGELR